MTLSRARVEAEGFAKMDGAGFARAIQHGLVLATAVIAVALLAAGPARTGDGWSAAQIEAITKLGPWPPAQPADPSNRLDGDPVAVEFGKGLFFDRRLSPVGALSCASCHKPERAWADGRMRASAAASLDRNTPSLLDVGFQRHFGWDGGHDSLWAQSIRPILDRRELGARPEDVRDLVTEDAGYAEAFRRLTNMSPETSAAERVLVIAAKALAAFQGTLVSGRTPFDDARDQIAQGRPPSATALSPAALRGLRLFIGPAGCVGCHAGARFTDDRFHAVLPLIPVQGRRLDRGRPDGLALLDASAYRRNGVHSDMPDPGSPDRPQPPEVAVKGAFRTPSLRGVALTGPYMHDGRHPTLAAAAAHGPEAARLTPDAIADLTAFLETLTPRP